jgi:hypothetical protein
MATASRFSPNRLYVEDGMFRRKPHQSDIDGLATALVLIAAVFMHPDFSYKTTFISEIFFKILVQKKFT